MFNTPLPVKEIEDANCHKAQSIDNSQYSQDTDDRFISKSRDFIEYFAQGNVEYHKPEERNADPSGQDNVVILWYSVLDKHHKFKSDNHQNGWEENEDLKYFLSPEQICYTLFLLVDRLGSSC